MHRILAAAAMLLIASPAAADVTATYVNARGYQTVVEVNDAGWARIGQTRREGDGLPDASIFLPDGDYAVLFDHSDMEGFNVVHWDVFRRAIIDSVRSGMGADEPLTAKEKTLAPAPCRYRAPSGKWCWRGGRARCTLAKATPIGASTIGW